MNFRFNFVFVITSIAFVCCQAFPGDQVLSLPGLSQNLTFRQYSGYLDVGNDRHLHYWFVESQSKPETDPLILWLNGGPGCSSLGGLWAENGPFRVSTDGKTIVEDKNSWNTLANVLYLESPAGVGYSYDNKTSLDNSDDKTAEDNYLALQKFFEKFPQFTNNSFYITGESYAGVYIPMLALKIYKSKSNINLKGVSIGNGALDHQLIYNSRIKMAYTHGLIDSLDNDMLCNKYCRCNHNSFECNFSNDTSDYLRERIVMNEINPYNIYSDCNPLIYYSSHYYHTLKTFFGIEFSEIQNNSQSLSSTSKCLSESFEEYLSSDEVRKALHIPQHLPKWKNCREINYRHQYLSMKSEVKELIEKHKIPTFIVYNGDIDLVCDFLGDQQFVDELGFKLIEKYKKWTVGGRTAGFVKRYEGISFMTVRGAGHMVPNDQPEAALAIIKELIGISKVI